MCSQSFFHHCTSLKGRIIYLQNRRQTLIQGKSHQGNRQKFQHSVPGNSYHVEDRIHRRFPDPQHKSRLQAETHNGAANWTPIISNKRINDKLCLMSYNRPTKGEEKKNKKVCMHKNIQCSFLPINQLTKIILVTVTLIKTFNI